VRGANLACKVYQAPRVGRANPEPRDLSGPGARGARSVRSVRLERRARRAILDYRGRRDRRATKAILAHKGHPDPLLKPETTLRWAEETFSPSQFLATNAGHR
jgi:hypothetical protein